MDMLEVAVPIVSTPKRRIEQVRPLDKREY